MQYSYHKWIRMLSVESVFYIKCLLILFVPSVWTSSCPDEFVEIGDDNHCVLIKEDLEMTWSEADWFCKKKNSNLLMSTHDAFFDEMIDFLNIKGLNKNFWVGSYFNKTLWYWIDGSVNTFNASHSSMNE